jgi:hypothetical protein
MTDLRSCIPGRICGGAALFDLLEAKDARIAELEAALREIISDELYNEAQMALIAEAALKEDRHEPD